MEEATGVVVLAQEGRFRLATDDGRSLLFVLAHDAPMEPQDLPALARSMARVTVHYRAADGRVAGLAHDVTEPGGQSRCHIGYLRLSRR